MMRKLPEYLANRTMKEHRKLAAVHLSGLDKDVYLAYVQVNIRITTIKKKYNLPHGSLYRRLEQATLKINRALASVEAHQLAKEKRWAEIDPVRLGLIGATRNALDAAGIHSIDKLMDKTTEQLELLSGFGWVSLGEIIKLLDSLGAPHKLVQMIKPHMVMAPHKALVEYIDKNWKGERLRPRNRKQRIHAAALIVTELGWVPEHIKQMAA